MFAYCVTRYGARFVTVRPWMSSTVTQLTPSPTREERSRWIRAASNGIALRPRGVPPPTPPRSFLTERGEFDSASDGPARGRAPSGLAPLAHLPQKTLGEVGVALDHGSANSIELRQAESPTPRPPPPSFLGERGRIRSCATGSLPFSLPHAVCGGGPGRGATHHLANIPRICVTPHPAHLWRLGSIINPLTTGVAHCILAR